MKSAAASRVRPARRSAMPARADAGLCESRVEPNDGLEVPVVVRREPLSRRSKLMVSSPEASVDATASWSCWS